MSSIIEGYKYDIFISYRQKDNKGDRWVSEFVEALKTELESTFKEEISVYFDINPHDGLLETHDVDESLKDKLKCLVFIPIISRTYCDPKSFAWEHEFKAFIELASKDKFGLKVKLPNGNVANRVLPIRIHDLDTVDIKECESVLGGVLRGLEFIYKEPGVNRPLKPDDDEKINLNKTKYRNQINKVANAIKEIISGLKFEAGNKVIKKIQHHFIKEEGKKESDNKVWQKASVLFRRKSLIRGISLAILLIAAVLAYSKIFQKDIIGKFKSSDGRLSIAVMPFKNMTHDTSWYYWQEGIQTYLIDALTTNNEDFKVIQIEPAKGLIKSRGITDYASLTPSLASSISKSVNSNIVICGSINRIGSTTRLSARLIDTEKNGPSDEELILPLIDSLRKSVTDYLSIEILKKKILPDLKSMVESNSPSAFKYFIRGQDSFYNMDYTSSIKYFTMSLEADSNLFSAIFYLTLTYWSVKQYDDARQWFSKLDRKSELMAEKSEKSKCWMDFLKGMLYKQPVEGIKALRQLQKIDDQSPAVYFGLGYNYSLLQQFRLAIPEFEKALAIYDKWGSKPPGTYYLPLIGIYSYTHQFKKEKKLIELAERDFPDDLNLIYQKIVMAVSENKSKDANELIEKYKTAGRDNSLSEAIILNRLAYIYSRTGFLDKSEEYYRQALSMEFKNSLILNDFAWFLIDKNINITEGLELIDKALKISPDNYNILDTKGWGLFKQNNYREALILIEKADSLTPEYSPIIYLHLKAAKKAVRNQK
jgi:tetratricopeptide (TPR) repeat protein